MINFREHFYLWATVSVGLLILKSFSYLAFHIFVEAATIALSLAFFLLSIKRSRTDKNTFFLILGCSFLGVTCIDILHLLTYKGMNIFSVDEANVATQFWLAGRFILAGGLLFGTLLGQISVRIEWVMCVVVSASMLLIWLIFKGHFPDAYIAGRGLTDFKIFSEYLIIGSIIFTLLVFSKMRASYDFNEQFCIILAMALIVLSEFSFTLYLDVYGFFNASGHIFKILSYALFLKILKYHLLPSPCRGTSI